MDRERAWNFLMSRLTIDEMLDMGLFRIMIATVVFISMTVVAVLWNGYSVWGISPASSSLFCWLFAIIAFVGFFGLPVYWQIFMIVFGVDLLAGGVIAPGWLLIVPMGMEAAFIVTRLAKWMRAKGILKQKRRKK